MVRRSISINKYDSHIIITIEALKKENSKTEVCKGRNMRYDRL